MIDDIKRRKVWLRRNKPFVHDQLNSEAAQEALSLSKRSVGSYYAGRHTTKKGTGLNDIEIKLLLPIILDSSVQDHDFRKRVDTFYTDIDTNVSYFNGRELDITLENEQEDVEQVFLGKSKLREDNMPLVTEDYVRFRHALKFPGTAVSPAAAKGNLLCEFYFEDPDKEVVSEVENINVADEAMRDYQLVKQSPEKVEMVLTLMRHWITPKPNTPAPVIYKLDSNQQVILLRDLAVSRPKQFHEITNDEFLTKKFMVDELISTGVLKRIGTTILIEDGGVAIGESLKDAVGYLFAPKQTQVLNELKAAYKDKTKDRKKEVVA